MANVQISVGCWWRCNDMDNLTHWIVPFFNLGLGSRVTNS